MSYLSHFRARLSLSRLNHLVRLGFLLPGVMLVLDAAAQSPSTLPPQVVTYDPSLSSAQADAEEESAVTISPDDRSTSIQRYGSGGRPSREVVDPPMLPKYSEAPPSEPQSVIPDSDPVRGDMVQPPMWTLWSW